jgi:tetratricopeptide (TPR) repeat protein
MHDGQGQPALMDRLRASFGALARFCMSVGLVLVVGILLYTYLPIVNRPAFANATRIMIALFAGLLPVIIYSYFIEGRRAILELEYRQNLRRLGLPANAQLYKDKFDAIYGKEQPGRPSKAQQYNDKFETIYDKEPRSGGSAPLFHSPVIVATLFSIIGWLLVFYPSRVAPDALGPNPEALAYGFLGAYIFGLGSLVRQYVTDDLQPRYYASLTYRYLTVFVLAWLIALFIPQDTSQTAPSAALASNLAPADELTAAQNYLLAAFFIGLFPTSGLLLVQRAATNLLRWTRIRGFNEPHPLEKIEGLNPYHEDRLLLEGVENLQSLSCARIVDLMLKTRYPVEQLIDWMDQALLHLHKPNDDDIDRFKSRGLRTATDFLDAYHPLGLADDELAKRRTELAGLLGQTEPQLRTLAAALQLDPNMYHIRYWRDHVNEPLPEGELREDIQRLRGEADLKLMQQLPDEAIAAYDAMLRVVPDDATALLYRGLAYFSLGEYRRAIDDYDAAIRQGGPTWANAHRAHLERGRARRELNEYSQAVDDYNTALKLTPGFPEAQLELAFVQMTYLGAFDDAIKNLDAVANQPLRRAEALANRGLARYNRWKNSKSPDENELRLARTDLKESLRLKATRIPPYITLAKVLIDLTRESEALQTLTDALIRLETADDRENAALAHQLRGDLYRKQQNYQAAATDYRIASQLTPNPNLKDAFFNLGGVLLNLDRVADALDAFTDSWRVASQEVLDKPNVADTSTFFSQLRDALKTLGDAAAKREMFDEARTAYSLVLQLRPLADDPSGQALARLNLGILHRRLSQQADTQAERELRQAQQLASARNALQEALKEQNERVFNQASYELGLLYLATERAEEAIPLLSDTAVLFDVVGDTRASADAYLNLGRAYIEQQDASKARDALDNAKMQLDRVFDQQNKDDLSRRSAIADAASEVQTLS